MREVAGRSPTRDVRPPFPDLLPLPCGIIHNDDECVILRDAFDIHIAL